MYRSEKCKTLKSDCDGRNYENPSVATKQNSSKISRARKPSGAGKNFKKFDLENFDEHKNFPKYEKYDNFEKFNKLEKFDKFEKNEEIGKFEDLDFQKT